MREWTYVTQVSIGRIYLWAKVFVERHSPESIVLDFPGDVQLLPEGVRGLCEKKEFGQIARHSSGVTARRTEYTPE